MNSQLKWLLCPVCKNKTRIQIRPDTILKYFPLYCPKCRQESLIHVQRLQLTVIKESDNEGYPDVGQIK